MKEFQIALKDRTYATPEKVHLNMGHLYIEQGKYPEAIRSFQMALEANPNYLRGMVGLGLAYQKAGRADQAKQELLKVVKLDPSSAEAAQARTLLDGQVKRPTP